MANWIILLFMVLASACLTKVIAVNNDSPTERKLFNGFPAAIWCKAVDDNWPAQKAADNETMQCEIKKDGLVILNDSFQWKDRASKGYFFNATSEWQNSTVTLSLIMLNNTSIRMLIFSVEESALLSDRNSKPGNWTLGKKLVISCRAPTEMEDPVTKKLRDCISEDQFNAIETVWRKDGKVISPDDSDFDFVPARYESGRFTALEISSPSFETSPGSFECSLVYGEHKIVVKRKSICIKDRENEKQPHIEAYKETYVVAPGDDLTVSCHAGGEGNTQGSVTWRKNGSSEELCSAFDGYSDPLNTCSLKFAIALFCKPASPEEISKALLANRRNFTSFFTLRNVTYENSGTYECSFSTFEDPVSAMFRIIVRKPRKTARNQLTIALAVAGGLLAVLLLFYTIYRWKRFEIQYFRKKFMKYRETDRPVTFLVYSDDVFKENVQNNALNDTSQWMKSQGYDFHNPSDSTSFLDAGEHVADHALRVLESCLSMTVILTPNLLQENTLEVFKIYAGFEDTVKRNFPIIFICTKEMEKRIFSRQKNSNDDLKYDELEKRDAMDVLKTLRWFMKRKRNTVIHWGPSGTPEFYRRLYVALPKARPPSSTPPKYEKGKEVCHDIPL